MKKENKNIPISKRVGFFSSLLFSSPLFYSDFKEEHTDGGEHSTVIRTTRREREREGNERHETALLLYQDKTRTDENLLYRRDNSFETEREREREREK